MELFSLVLYKQNLPNCHPSLTCHCVYTKISHVSSKKYPMILIFNRARLLRTGRNKTRTQLAVRIDVNQHTISSLEQVYDSSRLDLAMRICEVFELPVEVVFSRKQFELIPTRIYDRGRLYMSEFMQHIIIWVHRCQLQRIEWWQKYYDLSTNRFLKWQALQHHNALITKHYLAIAVILVYFSTQIWRQSWPTIWLLCTPVAIIALKVLGFSIKLQDPTSNVFGRIHHHHPLSPMTPIIKMMS